ncbi:DUF2933 domain-containing protein [Elioraea sp.]|uniref:DUF2933 domain-containing protein n=1 Tax=Elioraea sp. TaxID=2185103 RepID=UPI0025B96CE4|nr:DUF2933 domain-containing protein [Elioraea sp.]
MAWTQPVGTEAAPSWWRTRTGVAAIGFALVGSFYVLREHWGHAFGALPYLLILACPLMHLLMHRGHRQHGSGVGTAPGSRPGG